MKWSGFGEILLQSRLDAGIAQQSELAVALGIRQQTVSRWEKGLSRPKAAQISDIADAINADASNLFIAAGYGQKSISKSGPQTTLDTPWPVDALQPETFERFCADFLACLHGKNAKVHPYGSSGHKQHGLDIEVIFTDNTRFTYQCKRVASFGPKKIEQAVLAHTAKAKMKFILLSGFASPQSREEIKKYMGWQLWDREDITRQVRLELSKIDQQRLVDIYFRGQRLALLGELEPSPWNQPSDFFAGMIEPTSAFSHAWELVGREPELERLIEFTMQLKTRTILLVGNGGTGKSRLLKALSDHLKTNNESNLRVLFLARESLKSKDFEDLGGGFKLLICDDAHDRDDLALLASYAANPLNKTFLVLSLRSYGLQKVQNQTVALGLKDLSKIELKKLDMHNSMALAEQALIRFGGDKKYVSRLAKYTQDCPLATVVGAQILSSTPSLPEFLIDEDTFRGELMRRLVDTTVSGVSLGLDENSVRVTLGAIALLQPVKDDDKSLVEALGYVTSLKSHEVARILKRLRDAGLLYQRLEGCRIAPDLLGDFLIEDNCIISKDKSSGFAEKIFDAVPIAYAENILINLGRLDWRKSNGITKHSRLLKDIWSRLNGSSAYGYSHLRAAAAVAFYQPSQALEFVRRMLGEGNNDDILTQIIKNASYNFDFLPDACELLWKIGRNDNRPLHQQPSHGIRILSELATPQPGVPVEVMEVVADFAISLIYIEDSWCGINTPVEILKGALATEGYTTTSSARAISMSPFLVSQTAVAAIRRKVIVSLVDLLSHPDVARAIKAANAIHDALRYPRGLFGSSISKKMIHIWDKDFIITLKSINQLLDRIKISPTVLVKLAASVNWHVQHGNGQIKALSQRIIDRLEEDLRIRTIRMLVDGWGHLTREKVHGSWNAQQEELNIFALELISQFEDSDELYEFMESCLSEITVQEGTTGSPQILMNLLIDKSIDYAKRILSRSLTNTEVISSDYAGTALAHLLRTNTTEAHSRIDWLLDQLDQRLLNIVADAYWRYRPTEPYLETDIRALRKITTSEYSSVQRYAANALREVASNNVDLAIELVISANFEVSPAATHDYLMWLCSKDTIPFERLTSEHVQTILEKLVTLKDIDDYWVQEFIKCTILHHPGIAIEFFKSRIGTARKNKDWSYCPIPWSSSHRESFGLMRRVDAVQWLRELFDWAVSKEDSGESVLEWFDNLIECLIQPFDDIFIRFIESWMMYGGKSEVEIALCVLRKAPKNFVFEQKEFVSRMLRIACSHGQETLRHAISAFYSSAAFGMRSGKAGEPFHQDIVLKENAQQVLASLGRFEPSYVLYSDLLKHANLDIERQIREGQSMDEMDEL